MQRLRLRVHDLMAERGWDARELQWQARLYPNTIQSLLDDTAQQFSRSVLERLAVAFGTADLFELVEEEETDGSA